MRTPAVVGVVALTAALSCTHEGDVALAPDATGQDATGQDATGDTHIDASTTGAGEATADGTDAPLATDDGARAELPYARGLRIPRLTANQGVQVTLVDDGVEVPAAQYGTRLITGRRTLLRGFWTLHAAFEPREVIGQLTVDYDDGAQLVQDYPVTITGDSSDGGASFQWLLEPEQVRPGMRFRVRVVEADPTYEGGAISDPPPLAPLPGRGSLALYDKPLQMRVILVPVQHELDGCTMTPEPTAQDVVVMGQQLEQSNPIQAAFLEVGAPMLYTDPIGTANEGFSGVLAALAAHRAVIAPADNVYLYGLLDPCDGFPPGLLGQAIGIPGEAVPELANLRIATGRWQGSGLPTAETFVHEVGHSQGRRHVFCSGGEAGTDPAYPHPGGRIGVWGFGIYDFVLRSPTGARDYMTYCSNEWVSDYAWEQTLEVIETLTAWDTQAPPSDGEPLLMGSVLPDGRAHWWTTRGALDPTLLPSPHQLHLTIDDATVAVDATTQPQPDGIATTVTARLPARWATATELRLSGPALSLAIAPSAIRRPSRN